MNASKIWIEISSSYKEGVDKSMIYSKCASQIIIRLIGMLNEKTCYMITENPQGHSFSQDYPQVESFHYLSQEYVVSNISNLSSDEYLEIFNGQDFELACAWIIDRVNMQTMVSDVDMISAIIYIGYMTYPVSTGFAALRVGDGYTTCIYLDFSRLTMKKQEVFDMISNHFSQYDWISIQYHDVG
ncbi:MAG: hypothetical protein DYG96_10200 [Chlorobi bacterium CHB2]|nr:hypothetical protein [Chlorobi bacterium CHB2]